ncbi:MAG: phosphoglycerate mutase family protein, partial [Coprobacillus sp.]
MVKTLYLMRHGQTLFNVRRKIQGWCDAPLTSLGQAQAKIAGEYFQKNLIHFDHAYCSTSE